MNYEQWNKHTTDLQNKHGYTGKPKKGQLAQVSLYEFINDWLRPELQWKIMSYAVENPHKSLLKQVQGGYMPQFIPRGRASAMKMIVVGSGGGWAEGQLITPAFYHSKMDETSNYYRGQKGKWYMPLDIEPHSYDWDEQDPEDRADVLTRKLPHRIVMNDVYKRGYTWENRLVHNLKALRESNGKGRWTVSKKELLEHLKENNVKGRAKMAAASPPPGQFAYGVRISNNRNDAITALMKL